MGAVICGVDIIGRGWCGILTVEFTLRYPAQPVKFNHLFMAEGPGCDLQIFVERVDLKS